MHYIFVFSVACSADLVHGSCAVHYTLSPLSYCYHGSCHCSHVYHTIIHFRLSSPSPAPTATFNTTVQSLARFTWPRSQPLTSPLARQNIQTEGAFSCYGRLPKSRFYKTETLYIGLHHLFYMIWPSAKISHWNLLMTSTLEFLKIKWKLWKSYINLKDRKLRPYDFIWRVVHSRTRLSYQAVIYTTNSGGKKRQKLYILNI